MKKWFISVMVLTTMLSLGGCCWFHHHGYAGEHDGYNHHDWERDTYGDKDHYGHKDRDGWPK
jgi:hypothetical protein